MIINDLTIRIYNNTTTTTTKKLTSLVRWELEFLINVNVGLTECKKRIRERERKKKQRKEFLISNSKES